MGLVLNVAEAQVWEKFGEVFSYLQNVHDVNALYNKTKINWVVHMAKITICKCLYIAETQTRNS